MSYSMCKNITIKPKKNQIFVTIADNNVTSKTYYKSEYGGKLNCDLNDKLMYLMISMLDGNIQISQINKNTIDFEYAVIKVREYYRKNNINEYGEKFDKRYELYRQELSKYVNPEDRKTYCEFYNKNKELVSKIETDIKRNLYKTEFGIFKNAIEEKIEGKYYIKDDLGRTIEFVRDREYGFSYRAYDFPNEDCIVNYKLGYIRQKQMGDKFSLEKLEEKQEEQSINEDEEENIE